MLNEVQNITKTFIKCHKQTIFDNMAKQKMKQITIKLSERQMKGLEDLAEEMGDQPVSVVIRMAVASFLKEKNKI
jgi:hypothetical protein